ncbi:DUF2851 family protein [Patiriisocius hiemis]|uniref:DUF2851 family protein n=1 Tax=Patiriisocius hiemis TaxID=3075604 RepID=A0ABU2YEV5_9FLAO|nr:DUF2851 family protein [Constantimarinum sp. W242]MDT0556698.1 DUF2851 family protein [Constantimarinum sp. W242]
MKEDFLHYVWKFQKFSAKQLKTTTGDTVIISKPGSHNFNAGPDFFNASIQINEQLWAGNVEIHVKSSDWYAHGHESDSAYDSIILHVVWEHDTEVYRKDNTPIATLMLKEIVSNETLLQYKKLFSKEKRWIACENNFPEVDDFIIQNWLERLYIERLEEKSIFILNELERNNNHWEAVLYKILFKNFGLKVNGESFLSISNSIDFSVVQKVRHSMQSLEALFFGQAGLLSENYSDAYFESLKLEYAFLKQKFQLSQNTVINPKFFRLRPPNFPTLRLAQLASLFFNRPSLFSEIILAKHKEDYYDIFKVAASEYWDVHYNFEVLSATRKKKLTRGFIDLLIINTLIPIKFTYAKHTGEDNVKELFTLIEQIPKENNTVISRYNKLKKVANNALESQALLQLNSKYCQKLKCLNCAVGISIIG